MLFTIKVLKTGLVQPIEATSSYSILEDVFENNTDSENFVHCLEELVQEKETQAFGLEICHA